MTDEELDEAIHDTEEGVHRLLEGIKNHPNKVVRDAFEESVPKCRSEDILNCMNLL